MINPSRHRRARPVIIAATLFFGLAVTTVVRPAGSSGTTYASVPCGAATPSLVNGSFESLPDLPTTDGDNWRDFNGGNPPAQFLLVKDTALVDRIPGWRTTASDDYVEIQRQVPGFAQDGSDTASGYWDRKAPQAGHGLYWGELNAYEASALYQDIEAVSGQTYYWSLLHRGRVFNIPDVMKVLIGTPGSLVEQTPIWKFSPTNSDKFVGVPSFGSPGTSVSTISTRLEDGWTMYQGAYQASANGALRFQFEAVTASFANRVGNLLDGITFSVFEACDAARTLEVNDVVTLDMADPEFVRGDGHSLQSASIASGSSGTVTTNGTQIVFTGTSAGVTQVQYTVSSILNGGIQTRTATLTYTVNNPPTTTTSTTSTTTTTTTLAPGTTTTLAPVTTTTTVPAMSTPTSTTSTTEPRVERAETDSGQPEDEHDPTGGVDGLSGAEPVELPRTGLGMGWLVALAVLALSLGLAGRVTGRIATPARAANSADDR